MTFMEALQQELEVEYASTVKIIALYPADKADFKPHPKSMELKKLAVHLVDIFSWIPGAIVDEMVDFGTNPYDPPQADDAQGLLKIMSENKENALLQLFSNTDDILEKRWALKYNGQVIMDLTKYETIRHAFGQISHHRAQMGVYLRLLDIPIPGVYGPSADEM